MLTKTECSLRSAFPFDPLPFASPSWRIPGIPLYAEINEEGLHEKIDVINHKAEILRGMIQADSPKIPELGLVVGSIPPQNVFTNDPSTSIDLMKVGGDAQI